MNRLLAAYWRWFYLRRWRHIDVIRVAVDPTTEDATTPTNESNREGN